MRIILISIRLDNVSSLLYGKSHESHESCTMRPHRTHSLSTNSLKEIKHVCRNENHMTHLFFLLYAKSIKLFRFQHMIVLDWGYEYRWYRHLIIKWHLPTLQIRNSWIFRSYYYTEKMRNLPRKELIRSGNASFYDVKLFFINFYNVQ